MTVLIEWLRQKNRQRLERRNSSRRPKGPNPCKGIDFDEKVSPDAIQLPTSDNPEVSIIIPGYGKADYTLRCLKSLMTSGIGSRFEVLVVEDASGDRSAEALRQVEGIQLVWNDENLGFLRSCNKAVAMSKGEFIYLLNNDTIVTPGAVNALVNAARMRPDAGILGSKLIYPNGSLQEAGGVVWSNGDAANYGRHQDPNEPRFNYVREVDYISGASILLRRALWKLVDGFDERYVPAYYEDTDLSIRLQKMGRPTLYVPQSVVIHCEGVSNGTSTDHGIKAYQVVNREKFLAAHEAYLRNTRGQSGDLSYRTIDSLQRRAGLVLIVDHYLPEPDRDAGSRNMMEFVKTLLSLNYVVKFWPQNLVGTPDYVAPLEAMGVETLRGPYQRSFEQWVAGAGKDITHVLLSRPTVAPYYLDAVRRHTNAQVIYYGHDLHFARMKMEAAVTADESIAQAAERMLSTERSIWLRSDLVLYPSQEEVDTIHQIAPKVNVQFAPPFQFEKCVQKRSAHAGTTILFVAGFKHSPNVDAATWLVQAIMPQVWKACPEAQLYLVGSNPTQEVLDLGQTARVHVTGNVSDEMLTQHYASARVSVVPLRFGAGVKLKVLETMQQGVPLVTTDVGLQGLPEVASAVPAHNSAEQIASDLILLLRSDVEWIRRSQAQSHYVLTQFSTSRMRERFTEIMHANPETGRQNTLLDTKHAGLTPQSVRIIDGFTFYNEVDMLEFRLRCLEPYVDEFLIVEANHKFNGEPKPFVVAELMQSERFAWIRSKVRITTLNIDTHGLKLDKRPERYDPHADFWKIEAAQRNGIRLPAMASDDMLLMGDVDEIPNPDILRRLRDDHSFREWVSLEPRILRQQFFYYNPHCLKGEPWAGTALISGAVAARLSNQEVRDLRYSWHQIDHGGWHFSYFMPPDKIADKIRSFSHQELNTEQMRDTKRIAQAILSKQDLFARDEPIIEFNTQELPANVRTLLTRHFPYLGPL